MASSEVFTAVRARGDGGLDHDGGNGDGKKWADSKGLAAVVDVRRAGGRPRAPVEPRDNQPAVRAMLNSWRGHCSALLLTLPLRAAKGPESSALDTALLVPAPPSVSPGARGGGVSHLPEDAPTAAPSPALGAGALTPSFSLGAGPSQTEASPHDLSGLVPWFRPGLGPGSAVTSSCGAPWGKLLTVLYLSVLVCGVRGAPPSQVAARI